MSIFLNLNHPNVFPRKRLFAFASFLVAYVAYVLVASVSLKAEGFSATLMGTVSDPSYAPIPAAVVTISASDGLVRSTTTDHAGGFHFRDVIPGAYRVLVSAPGSKGAAEETVNVEPGQVRTLAFWLPQAYQDSATPPATTAQQPNGPAEAATSGSPRTSPAVNRISESQLAGLPMNGRSYSQLATLQAGVSSDSSSSSASRGVSGGGLTVSGSRSTANVFLLDGTNIMNTANQVPRSAAGVQLGSDAVAQVQVFSTNYTAEYGRGSGGVLNSISRTGTDAFRGTLFEFLRNSKLDARNFFDAQEPPPFKRNQFGFTLTGPIATERTYFMGSFEAMRDRLSETLVNFFPDEPARTGTILRRDGSVEQVPLHPEVPAYLALYPRPNGESLGDGIAEHRAPVFEPTDEDFFVVRVDHKISDRDSLFARYTFDDATSVSPGSAYLFRSKNLTRQQYLTLVASSIFNLSTVNSFRFGYTRPVSFIVDDLDIVIPPQLFFVPGAAQFGQISVPGLTTFGPAGGNPEQSIMNTFQFSDNLLLQRGSHALKFGFDVHRYRWDVYNQTNKFGQWSFSSLQSFLQGGPSGTRLSVALPGSDNYKALRQTLLGFYAHDDFQLRSNLQLSLGLRYEFVTVIHERDGRIGQVRDPLRDSQATIGPYFEGNPSLRNFSPRIGISWSPGPAGNTTVSAGFGIYHDQIIEYLVHQQRSSVPFYFRVSRVNFDATNTFPNAVAAVAEDSTPPLAQTGDYYHTTDPMVLRYDLSIQRQLPGNWQLRAAYVGARANHLWRTSEINQMPVPIIRPDGSLCFPPDIAQNPVFDPSCPPVSSQRAGPVNPNFSSINLVTSDAQSFYNAFQVSTSKSLGRQLSIQANYTWSKSVDDASSHQAGNDSAYQYGLRRTLSRGLSDFDIRHRFTMNYFYTLPSLSAWSPFLSSLVGGWRLGGILTLRTGNPFTPSINVPSRGYLFSATLPNLNPGWSNNPVLGASNRYFDPAAFSVPPPGTLGNLGRNTLIGPRVFNLDVSLQKEFVLGAERRFQFRVEFFNLPNHTNFDKPSNTTVFSGASGRLNPTVGRISNTATTARQIQFALRFSF